MSLARFGIYLPQHAPTRMMKSFFKANQVPPQLNPSFATMGWGGGIFCSLKAGAACAKARPFSCKATCCRLPVFWKTGYKNAETHFFAPENKRKPKKEFSNQKNRPFAPKGIIQPSILKGVKNDRFQVNWVNSRIFLGRFT